MHSPHPFNSTFGGFTFIGSLTRTLVHLITLQMNAFRGSITIANGYLYLASCYSILGFLGIVYYILSRIWNYTALFTNCISFAITFFSSFCYIVTSLITSTNLGHYSIYVCCHSTIFIWKIFSIFFVTNLNPYNKCLLIFNS